jgi:hypothetical protein
MRSKNKCFYDRLVNTIYLISILNLCYGNDEFQPIKVTAGMTNELDTSDPSRQQRRASAFKVHPEYKGQPEDNRNDICLLKLDKPLDVGQAVSPIQLPSQDEEPSLSGS